MKFTATLVVIAAQLAGLAAAVPADAAAAECGELGVLKWTASDFKDKPNVDLGAIRKCREPFAPGAHGAPGFSKVRRADEALASPLEKRACYYGKSYGCDKGKDGGRCWKRCGDGPWCWTARNQGFGAWYTCNKDSDCGTSQACGQAVNGCKECGCSC